MSNKKQKKIKGGEKIDLKGYEIHVLPEIYNTTCSGQLSKLTTDGYIDQASLFKSLVENYGNFIEYTDANKTAIQLKDSNNPNKANPLEAVDCKQLVILTKKGEKKALGIFCIQEIETVTIDSINYQIPIIATVLKLDNKEKHIFHKMFTLYRQKFVKDYNIYILHAVPSAQLLYRKLYRTDQGKGNYIDIDNKGNGQIGFKFLTYTNLQNITEEKVIVDKCGRDINKTTTDNKFKEYIEQLNSTNNCISETHQKWMYYISNEDIISPDIETKIVAGLIDMKEGGKTKYDDEVDDYTPKLAEDYYTAVEGKTLNNQIEKTEFEEYQQKVFPNQTDGNCLFGALAQIYKGADNVPQIKDLSGVIRNFISQLYNRAGIDSKFRQIYKIPEHFTEIIGSNGVTYNETNPGTRRTLKEWAKHISTDGIWATDDEMSLFSKILKIPINSYEHKNWSEIDQNGNKQNYTAYISQFIYQPDNITFKDTYNIVNVNNGHYMLSQVGYKKTDDTIVNNLEEGFNKILQYIEDNNANEDKLKDLFYMSTPETQGLIENVQPVFVFPLDEVKNQRNKDDKKPDPNNSPPPKREKLPIPKPTKPPPDYKKIVEHLDITKITPDKITTISKKLQLIKNA